MAELCIENARKTNKAYNLKFLFKMYGSESQIIEVAKTCLK